MTEEKYQKLLNDLEKEEDKERAQLPPIRIEVRHRFAVEALTTIMLVLGVMLLLMVIGVDFGAVAGEIANEFCKEFDGCG